MVTRFMFGAWNLFLIGFAPFAGPIRLVSVHSVRMRYLRRLITFCLPGFSTGSAKLSTLFNLKLLVSRSVGRLCTPIYLSKGIQHYKLAMTSSASIGITCIQ